MHSLIDTLPEDVVRRVENGDPVTLVVRRERGRLEMREIDPEQAWFWTPEWQKGEQEADAELADGAGVVYRSTDEFISHLKSVPPSKSD